MKPSKRRQMIETLERRVNFLTDRIAERDTTRALLDPPRSADAGDWDRAERQALLWALSVVDPKDAVVATSNGVRADERYAIYVLAGDNVHTKIAETSKDGVGLCLVTLRDEEQITNDSRVGVFDQQARRWIVNPWAVGDRPFPWAVGDPK